MLFVYTSICGSNEYPIYQTIMNDQERESNSDIFGEPQRYLLIQKDAIPSKQMYLPTDNITIFVEIKPLKFRDMSDNFEDINVYELIDQNLSLLSKSDNGLVTADLRSLNDYKSFYSASMFNNSSFRLVNLSWENNYGELHIEKMGSWERLLYSYQVKPKRAGILSTDTIIRAPYFSDIDKRLKLEISKGGLYNVNIVLSKNRVFQKEMFQAYYTITYLGDGQTSAIVDFENATNKPFSYDMSYNKTLNFSSKYESYLVPLNLSYNRKGSFPLPGISIDGSLSLYDKTIIVDSFFERYWQFLQLLILIGTIIGGVLTFIKYGAGKSQNPNYSLYNLINDIRNDILNIIQNMCVENLIIWSTLATSLTIYIVICAIYPEEFISAYVFIVDHWTMVEVGFVGIFVYIIYKIMKINFLFHNVNRWGNWLFSVILIISWLLFITILLNYLKILSLYHRFT